MCPDIGLGTICFMNLGFPNAFNIPPASEMEDLLSQSKPGASYALLEIYKLFKVFLLTKSPCTVTRIFLRFFLKKIHLPTSWRQL